MDFQWFDKVTTRMPEALYFSVEPVLTPSTKWTMYKLGRPIDPLNVRLNGSQYVHGELFKNINKLLKKCSITFTYILYSFSANS